MAEISEESVRHLYVGRQLTTRKMAEVLGVGHRTAVRLVHRFGIQPRDQGAKKITQLHDRNWLKRKYETERLSTVQIAELLGCTPRVVVDGLRRFGILSRPRCQNAGRKFGPETRRKQSLARAGKFLGESNPNWKGGYVDPTARERKSHNARQWRDAVKARDGQKCVECGNKNGLHAHHIASWKDNPHLRFELSNGKTLCVRCHQKAHGFPFSAWIYRQGETATSTTPSQEVKI